MSVSVTKYKNLVGGEWVDAASGETMEVLNPSTGEVIAEVPRSSAEDVERAVDAAGKAFAEWADKTPKDRMELLLKLADVIDDNAEELTQLESQNVGKPMAIAGDEMPFSADNLRFFAGAARTLEGKAAGEYVEGYTSIIRREPLGIVAGITPWNYPLMMAVWKLGPALAAGNVQILKPAEQTPLTTLRFAELAQEFLPPGVLQVVTGDGLPAGDALVRHPEIRLVSLTGSVETGRLIAAGAAQSNLKRVHLELGGKAPMVVLDDADPATVAEAIKIGGYWNSGQDCTASSRILVHETRLRRRHVRDGEDTRGDEGCRPGRGRRRRHGPRDLEGAAGARARLPRAGGRAGRRRSSPAASRSATAASSSSRPSSRTSPRTRRSSRARSSGRS